MWMVDRRRGQPFILALLLVVLAGGIIVVYCRVFVSSGHVGLGNHSQIGTRTTQATTSTGRRGGYYLPQDYPSHTLPLLVILHGTGGKGAAMIYRLSVLRALAEREKFIVIAPDSVSVVGVWVVSSHGLTEDYQHVMDCVREVLALPDINVDRAHVLLAGFSVGGGAASYIASHEALFSAFAVLHGHVALDGMGPRRVRVWLSTGNRDRRRPVAYITRVADHLTRGEGFPEVETHVFRGDHTLGEEELAALIAWWLHREDNPATQR